MLNKNVEVLWAVTPTRRMRTPCSSARPSTPPPPTAREPASAAPPSAASPTGWSCIQPLPGQGTDGRRRVRQRRPRAVLRRLRARSGRDRGQAEAILADGQAPLPARRRTPRDPGRVPGGGRKVSRTCTSSTLTPTPTCGTTIWASRSPTPACCAAAASSSATERSSSSASARATRASLSGDGTTSSPTDLTSKGWRTLSQQLRANPSTLTVDLDVLDPSVFPGTGTPEPGGVSFDALRKAAHRCVLRR